MVSGMSVITTHVLDTVLGRPAAAVGVRLERFDEDSWLTIAESATDADGHCFLADRHDFDLASPPANPTFHQTLRRALGDSVRRFIAAA